MPMTSSIGWPATIVSACRLTSSPPSLADPLDFVGTAPTQVEAFVAAVDAVIAVHPDAARYEAEPML